MTTLVNSSCSLKPWRATINRIKSGWSFSAISQSKKELPARLVKQTVERKAISAFSTEKMEARCVCAWVNDEDVCDLWSLDPVSIPLGKSQSAGRAEKRKFSKSMRRSGMEATNEIEIPSPFFRPPLNYSTVLPFLSSCFLSFRWIHAAFIPGARGRRRFDL